MRLEECVPGLRVIANGEHDYREFQNDPGVITHVGGNGLVLVRFDNGISWNFWEEGLECLRPQVDTSNDEEWD